jgi:hypothetical protein
MVRVRIVGLSLMRNSKNEAGASWQTYVLMGTFRVKI